VPEIESMPDALRREAVNDFLGSAQVFIAALSEALDANVLREIAGKGFTISQLRLLRLVSLRKDHSLGSLAAFLGVSAAAASKAVERLARRMYLRRSEGELDRRFVHLSLTELGRRTLAAFDAARGKRIEEIFVGLSADELHRAGELMQGLSARIVELGLNAEAICLKCGMYFPDRCLIQERIGHSCNYLVYKSRK
jgi:DNA-binding MarR family transcriptional regulator